MRLGHSALFLSEDIYRPSHSFPAFLEIETLFTRLSFYEFGDVRVVGVSSDILVNSPPLKRLIVVPIVVATHKRVEAG